MAVSANSPLTAICGKCIAKLNHLSRIGKLTEIYFSGDQAWAALSNELTASMSPIQATSEVKQRVGDVMMRFARRSAAILGGAKAVAMTCPLRDVRLVRQRLAIVTMRPDLVLELISACCELLGFPIVRAIPAAVFHAANELLSASNNDPLIFDHAILYVDGYVESNLRTNILCAVPCDDQLPDYIERTYLDAEATP